MKRRLEKTLKKNRRQPVWLPGNMLESHVRLRKQLPTFSTITGNAGRDAIFPSGRPASGIARRFSTLGNHVINGEGPLFISAILATISIPAEKIPSVQFHPHHTIDSMRHGNEQSDNDRHFPSALCGMQMLIRLLHRHGLPLAKQHHGPAHRYDIHRLEAGVQNKHGCVKFCAFHISG